MQPGIGLNTSHIPSSESQFIQHGSQHPYNHLPPAESQFIQHGSQHPYNYYTSPNFIYGNDYRSSFQMPGFNIQHPHMNTVVSHPYVPLTQGDKISVTDSVVTSGITDLLNFPMVKPQLSQSTASVVYSSSTASTEPKVTSSISSTQTSVPGSYSSGIAISTTTTSASNTGISAKKSDSATGGYLSNVCLAFMRSLTLRNVQHSVIDNTVKNFTLDELNAAREALYRHSGTTRYRAIGLQESATPHQRSSHCAASIIEKFAELEKSHNVPKIVCEAEDIYRLLQISGNTINSKSVEDRLSVLEREVSALKSSKMDANYPTLQSTYADASNRHNLLNRVNQRQASAFKDSSSTTPKRNRSIEVETVTPNKKVKLQVISGGKNGAYAKNLSGPKFHDVFLFNYSVDVEDGAVKSHFEDVGVKIVFFKRISRDDHYIKNFLMKIPNKDDFEKITNNLPPRTGTRWFIQDGNPRDQPSFFNKEMPLMNLSTPSTPIRQLLVNNQQSGGVTIPSASSHAVSGLIASSASIFTPLGIASNTKQTTDAPKPQMSDTTTDDKSLKSPGRETPNVDTHNRFEVLSEHGMPSFKIGGSISLNHIDTEGDQQIVTTTSS